MIHSVGPILITGALKRLGRAIALHLAEEGRSLLLHYRSGENEVDALLSLCRKKALYPSQTFEAIQGDFSTRTSLNDFIERLHIHENIDFLYGIINNVGAFPIGPLSEMSDEEASLLVHLNVLVPMSIINALIPKMKKNGSGAIVNIGTAGLSHLANKYAPLYHASKGMLLSLTKSYAVELAQSSISVNMVSPGKLDISVDREHLSHNIPYGRLGNILEVARAVSFCIDEKNNYMTGQNIEIAGGFCL